MKRAMCSRFPKFAAYFRRTIPEVRSKTEIWEPDPDFTLPQPAVLLGKIELCSEVSDFSSTSGQRDKTKHLKAESTIRNHLNK